MLVFNQCQNQKPAINWFLGQLSGFSGESLPLCKMPLLVTAGAFFVYGTISGTNILLSFVPVKS